MDLKKRHELTRKILASIADSKLYYVFENKSHVIDIDDFNHGYAAFDRYLAAHASFGEKSPKAEKISKGDVNSLKLVKAIKSNEDGFLLPDIMVGIVQSPEGKFYGVASMLYKEGSKDRYGKEHYFNLSAQKNADVAFLQMKDIFNEMMSGSITATAFFKDKSDITFVGTCAYKSPQYEAESLVGNEGVASKVKEITAAMNQATRDEFVKIITTDMGFLKKSAHMKRIVACKDKLEKLPTMRTKTQERIIKANLNKRVVAAGMARLVEHMEKALSGQGTFAIFTSQQSEATTSPETNKLNYKQLGSILNNVKNGAIPMKGVWQGTAEPSYFVPGVTLEWAKMLSQKYSQWAFIFCGPDTDGKVQLWATPSNTQGEIAYSVAMEWDAYAVNGLDKPEGYSVSPDKKKFSFYEGDDNQDYATVVSKLNAWANQALDSVTKTEEAPQEQKVAASRKIVAKNIDDMNYFQLGREINSALPSGSSNLRPNAEALKKAAESLGVSVSVAKKALSIFNFDNDSPDAKKKVKSSVESPVQNGDLDMGGDFEGIQASMDDDEDDAEDPSFGEIEAALDPEAEDKEPVDLKKEPWKEHDDIKASRFKKSTVGDVRDYVKENFDVAMKDFISRYQKDPADTTPEWEKAMEQVYRQNRVGESSNFVVDYKEDIVDKYLSNEYSKKHNEAVTAKKKVKASEKIDIKDQEGNSMALSKTPLQIGDVGVYYDPKRHGDNATKAWYVTDIKKEGSGDRILLGSGSGSYAADVVWKLENADSYEGIIYGKKKVKSTLERRATETTMGKPSQKKGSPTVSTVKETKDLTTEISDEGEELDVDTFKKGARVYLPNKGNGTVLETMDNGNVMVRFDQGDKVVKEVNPVDLEEEKEHDEGLEIELMDTGRNVQSSRKRKPSSQINIF